MNHTLGLLFSLLFAATAIVACEDETTSGDQNTNTGDGGSGAGGDPSTGSNSAGAPAGGMGGQGIGGSGGDGGSEPMCNAAPGDSCGTCMADNCCVHALPCGADAGCLQGTICLATCTDDLPTCLSTCAVDNNATWDNYAGCMTSACSNDCP